MCQVTSNSKTYYLSADDWFRKVVYEDSKFNLEIDQHIDQLFVVIFQMHSAGKFDGYSFLFDMPGDQGIEWVVKAMRDCRAIHHSDPDSFPVGGIKDSFDRLRALRKARNKARKEYSQKDKVK